MMKPIYLRVEYLDEPVGLVTHTPRFDWRYDVSKRRFRQVAYRVLVSSSRDNLDRELGDFWDSGRVPSSVSSQITYAGLPLVSGHVFFWKVQVWSDENRIYESDVASFRMGLISPAEWCAEWLGFRALSAGGALIFRTDFQVEQPIRDAVVYVTGLGYYELSINGSKVGDRVLEPGYTDYNKRILYSTYGVKDYLNEEDNTIGVQVGNGWSGHRIMRFQLEIEYVDGSKKLVISNSRRGSGYERWKVARSPIVESSIYDGETYDARLEQLGWDCPGFQLHDSTRDRLTCWGHVFPAYPPVGAMVSQVNEPIKVVKQLRAVNISEPQPGVYVFDFGQNFAGWCELAAKSYMGNRIVLKYAELIHEDGLVNQENLNFALAQDVYIARSDELETWQPKFTFHGFRYVQIEGLTQQPEKNILLGCVVRSAIIEKSSFKCDNVLFNKIESCVRWTEESNLHSIPSDCPQRGERQGWLNDLTPRSEQLIYLFEAASFFYKWLYDIKDTQNADTGAVADTAPWGWGGKSGDPVCISPILIPWWLYLHYNDTKVLSEHYEMMKAWVRFQENESDAFILSFSSWGDWASPVTESDVDSIGSGAMSSVTPGELVSTGFFFYSTMLMAKISAILNYNEDSQYYIKLSSQVFSAFNERFWNEAIQGYATGSQACNAMALYLKLVPEDREKAVAESLVKEVLVKYKGHLATGNQCTKHLLEALTEYGHVDTAYTIASKETYPSWGYMIANGATTIWERWELQTSRGMYSHNHAMHGTLSTWFYKYLAGIKAMESAPGFEQFEVCPYYPTGLNQVEASVETPRGRLAVKWMRDEASLSLELTVPANSRAWVYLPYADNSEQTHYMINGQLYWNEGKYLKNTLQIQRCERLSDYLLIEIAGGRHRIETRGSFFRLSSRYRKDMPEKIK